MNKKLQLKLLVISVTVFIISTEFSLSGFDNVWITIPSGILSFVSLPYIIIFIPFAIIQNYSALKERLYQSPLDGHRKTIERDSNWHRDAIGFFSFCTIFNFFLFFLFSTTPVIPTLEELPYVHLFNLSNLSDNNTIHFLGVGYNPGDDILILMIMLAGPTILFVFRQLHYKLTRCVNMKRYPGSRFLLLFFYVIPIVSFTNIGLIYFKYKMNGGQPPYVLLNLNNGTLDTIIILGLLVIAIIWIFDRKLFSKRDQVRTKSEPMHDSENKHPGNEV